ncbi:hypothetical protein ATW55_09575 [Ferroacidibacillus organovorans]|uniref:DUF6431 domain-containing protein n=2 Tax=Ferroacidibacillus organovorans TaxID=1765683 RepID=A0A101XRJ3_9BACL|nr:hypothetical protein ATW55_09575 [Ferroacidibacillus organovorans]
MPIVCLIGLPVNPIMPGHLKDFYLSWVASLLPADQPCIHCANPRTHGHGFYPRSIHFEHFSEFLCIHRRHCPACNQTFGLLPETVAPYQRVAISVQDAVVSELGSGRSYTKVSETISSPLGPLSMQTLKRWYIRGSQQIQSIAPRFSALMLSVQPACLIPSIPHSVRDRTVCFFYAMGEQWHDVGGSGISAAWNALRTMLYLFSPSVSVNRVSYGLSPGHFP